MEKDDNKRLTALVDQISLENRMSEEERREKDYEAAKNEFERLVSNCVEHKVLWTTLFNKRELNQQPNEKIIDAFKNVWGIDMKVRMKNL